MGSVLDARGLEGGSRPWRSPIEPAQLANPYSFPPTSAEAGFLVGDALIECEASRQGSQMDGEPPEGQHPEGQWQEKGGEVAENVEEAHRVTASGPRAPAQGLRNLSLVFLFSPNAPRPA